MKAFGLILAGLLAAGSASAATNLVVIGGKSTLSSPAFNLQGIPWQVNVVPLVILACGFVHLFCPRFCWYLKWGWRFADSEPSDLWLFFERAGGVLIIGFAIFVFFGVNGWLPHDMRFTQR